MRDWARDHGEYVLTNPDMLHRSLLPGHARWARFFGSLRYVVVDECHHYRGVFGAHVAQIMRRLRRVAALYGAHPTFVLASATVAEPGGVGRPADRPARSRPSPRTGRPRGRTALALWEPPFTPGVGENGAPVRRSAASRGGRPARPTSWSSGVRTLAFVRSRRGAETVAAHRPAPARRGRPRASPTGWPPTAAATSPRTAASSSRRCATGDSSGWPRPTPSSSASTSAGSTPCCWPASPAPAPPCGSRSGRAGRGARDALGVLVARDDPLDTYLVNHPEALLGQPVEANVFDPDNPYVLGPHLCAAAAESPLDRGRPAAVRSGRPGGGGRARPRAACCGGGRAGWFWTDRRRASDLADIRSTGGPPGPAGRGRHRAGARHRRRRARPTARPTPGRSTSTRARPGWSPSSTSRSRSRSWCPPTRTTRPRPARSPTSRSSPSASTAAWGAARLSLGDVRVTHQVVSFLKRRVPVGRGARRGAARPARADPRRPPRSGGPCPTTSSPSPASPAADLPGRRPRRRARLDRPAARCSRPATAGTSAASPPRCTLTPVSSRSSSTTAIPAAPASPSAASTPPAAWLARDPRGDRVVPLRRGLPVVRAVTQVRQPEQPARQAGRDRPARPPARGRSATTRV